MKLTILFILVVFTFISACSTGNKNIVIAPEVIGVTQNVYINNKVEFRVIDRRINTYVVQIINEDKPVSLIRSKRNLKSVLETTITPLLRKQGLTLNSLSQIKLDIIINKALIKVQQSLFSYTTESYIELTAFVLGTEISFTKIFSASAQSKGILQADIAVLERDFNNQLATLITNITNNIEVQNTIKLQNNH